MKPGTRLALLVAVPLCAYASAPRNGFVWDDHRAIEEGLLIGSLANVPSLFTHDTMWNSDGGRYANSAAVDTYRPLTMTTFFVERALFGRRPAGFHVVSVLIHLANVLLLFAVARRLRLSVGAALFGALLFGAHPAISEAVHWIDGRSDPLCLLCFLAGLWVWLGRRSPERDLARGLVVALLAFAATLCKETAFLLLPTLVLLLPREARLPAAPRASPTVRALWPWAIGGALGLAARLAALHGAAVSGATAQLGYALRRLPIIWLDGIRSLALPRAEMLVSLHDHYARFSLASTVAGGALVLGLAALARVRWRSEDRLPAFALAAFVFTTAPVALLSASPSWSGWGRYLYAAAAPACLAIAAAVHDRLLPSLRPSVRRFVVAGSALLILLCTAETFAAGFAWHDDRSFALAQIDDHPELAMGYVELAGVELNGGHLHAAVAAADQAIALDSRRPLAYSRRAVALYGLGRLNEAFASARVALTLDASDYNARLVQVAAWIEERNEEPAARLLLEVLAEQPNQEGAWRLAQTGIDRLSPRFKALLVSAASDPRWVEVAPRLRELTR